MDKQYAVVVRVRMQVSGYVKNPEIVNLQNNIVVDLKDHKQKEEVDVGWFYNAETNTFSKEGVVTYPEPEPEPESEPEPLTEIEQCILDTSLNTEYLVCLADLGI